MEAKQVAGKYYDDSCNVGSKIHCRQRYVLLMSSNLCLPAFDRRHSGRRIGVCSHPGKRGQVQGESRTIHHLCQGSQLSQVSTDIFLYGLAKTKQLHFSW